MNAGTNWGVPEPIHVRYGGMTNKMKRMGEREKYICSFIFHCIHYPYFYVFIFNANNCLEKAKVSVSSQFSSCGT